MLPHAEPMTDQSQRRANVRDECFPGQYKSADQASISAQRRYFRLHTVHLTCLIVVSAAGATSAVTPLSDSALLPYAIAILLVSSIAMSLILWTRKYDQEWFNCRALAESTKTASWKYMMRADRSDKERTAKEQFISRLRGIQRSQLEAAKATAPALDPSAVMISNFMQHVRSSSLDERKTLYLSARLIDQKLWYAKKAQHNATMRSRLFCVSLALQLVGIIFAIGTVFLGAWLVHIVPILVTCGAGTIAWSHMKRHSVLSQSYALAANELAYQEPRAEDIFNEADFAVFVNDVEDAISREHTLWLARQDAVISSLNEPAD